MEMLYVDMEINGVPVKAFVDSGAQMSIMTEVRVEQWVCRRVFVELHAVERVSGKAHTVAWISKASTAHTRLTFYSHNRVSRQAQHTLIYASLTSQDFASKCHIGHLVDKRFQGMAVGVGQSKIIGKVHQVR